jgi:hypothetical protein
MKIEVIKAAVDRLKTSEHRGIVVNAEALEGLRELLSVPVIERPDALKQALELLARVYNQGDTQGVIGEEIGNFLAQKNDFNLERPLEPFGYWLFPKGSPLLGMFHKPSPDIETASVKESFELTALYADSEIAALRAELERYKIANARLAGTIEKVAAVALTNKNEAERLQQCMTPGN